MPRSIRRKLAAPTADEVRRLLEAVKGDRLEAIVTVALALGLRRAEIPGLRLEDVDLDRRTLTVRNRVNRVNKLGIIRPRRHQNRSRRRTHHRPPPIHRPVPAHAPYSPTRNQTRRGPKWQGPAYPNATPTGYVFTSTTGTILDPRNLNRYFSRVRAKANLPTHTFHQLRHDCASLLLAQGIPLWAVSKILGHSGIQITANIYGHLATDLQWDAANKMDTLLGMARDGSG